METLVTKKSPSGEGAKRQPKKSPSAANKALMSRNLRIAYGEVASEPLPEHLLALLEQIDKKDGGAKS